MVDPRTRELNWNLRGLSVTAPHKQSVMQHLDWIEPNAKEIGAVNTVVVENDRLLGYNTDAAGLIEPLLQRFGSLADRAGGDNRRRRRGAGSDLGVATTESQSDALRAQRRQSTKLAELFNIPCESLSSAKFAGYDLVINTTPLGSGEHIDQSPATAGQLNGARCVYDLDLQSDARRSSCVKRARLVARRSVEWKCWWRRQNPV